MSIVLYPARSLALRRGVSSENPFTGTLVGGKAPSFMHAITEFFNRFVNGLLRLLLVAAAGVFLLSLLFATLVMMLVLTVWSIVTGRKPELGKIFGQFRQTSARYSRGAWSSGRGGAASAKPQDIVDVPAHEVRDVQRQPRSNGDSTKPPGNDPMARMLH